MSNIIKQFDKLKIPIFKEINKVYYGKLDKVNYRILNDIRDCEVCAIGQIRERFGLPVNKIGQVYNGCSKCGDLAGRFADIVYQLENKHEELESYKGHYLEYRTERELKEKREEYQGLLLEVKQHFRLTYKKEIDQ